MVLSKKRYFCKGDGEVWKNLEIYAAKCEVSEYWGWKGIPPGVWLGPLYIEPSI